LRAVLKLVVVIHNLQVLQMVVVVMRVYLLAMLKHKDFPSVSLSGRMRVA